VRALSVLPILAVLSFASAAIADPPPGTIMKATPPAANGTLPDVAKICVMQFQQSVATLGVLEQALALTDKQKPLFDSWKKARVETMHGWPCPKPATGPDVPTPLRLDREASLLAYEVDALHREKPLVAALYEALSPEQRTTFDHPPMRHAAPIAEKAKPEAQPAH
jgi:hypothetical protein